MSRRRTVRPELAAKHVELMKTLHGTGEQHGKARAKAKGRKVLHWSASGLVEIEVDGKHAKRERGGRLPSPGLPRKGERP